MGALSLVASLPWPLLSLQLLLTWASNLWLFTSSLLIYQLQPGSLLLPAVHGVVGMISTLLISPYLGAWVDLTPRLRAATTLTIVQGAATALSSVSLGLGLHNLASFSSTHLLLLLAFVLGTAAIGGLAAGGLTLLIQKDWLVVIYGESPDSLARVNSAFRALDLGTRSIAPLIAGLTLSHLSYPAVAAIQAVVILIFTVGQVLMFRVLHSLHSALAEDRKGVPAENSTADTKEKFLEGLCRKAKHTVGGFKFFAKHRLCLAGVSLAMLYLTVLGFDSITISFCKASGVDESLVGLLMGVSSLLGFLGSVAFPLLRAKLGTPFTALIGVSILVVCDAVCAISIFLPSSQFMTETEGSETTNMGPVYMFVSGLTVARFGLHLYDLCVIQLFQEGVEEEKRGVFSGVETSLCYGMDLIKFVLVLFFPSPTKHFGYLVLVSFSSVFAGLCFFVLFIWRSRRLEKVRPGTWRGGEEEDDVNKRARMWTHEDELDREAQPLSVPT